MSLSSASGLAAAVPGNSGAIKAAQTAEELLKLLEEDLGPSGPLTDSAVEAVSTTNSSLEALSTDDVEVITDEPAVSSPSSDVEGMWSQEFPEPGGGTQVRQAPYDFSDEALPGQGSVSNDASSSSVPDPDGTSTSGVGAPDDVGGLNSTVKTAVGNGSGPVSLDSDVLKSLVNEFEDNKEVPTAKTKAVGLESEGSETESPPEFVEEGISVTPVRPFPASPADPVGPNA